MKNRTLSVRALVALISISLFALLLSSCTGGNNANGGGGSETRIQGAGATFPNVIYQKWFSEYNKSNPGVKFDYQSIGSGGGIKQITEKTVDFGGSDAPMKDEDLSKVQGQILHIPTVLGAVVLTHNVPGVAGELKFTPEAVAGIFLGKIKKWNDPAIASVNEGITLPANDITVVHRSDGSGTTFVFTDYLAKVSPDWKSGPGTGPSPNWPVGVGAKGNEGVTGQVKQTPNSIGYVELIYAEQNKLPVDSLKNAAGEWIKPSLDSTSAAAAGVQIPDDMRVSITNSSSSGAYPISSFTYLLVYKEQADQAKGKALVDFLWWATHDGQKMAKDMTYAPLPADVVKKAEDKIKAITYQGKPLRA